MGRKPDAIACWIGHRSHSGFIQGHTAAVWGVALSGDARLAVSASADFTLKVWDVEGGRELKNSCESLWGVAMNRGGGLVVSCSLDNSLKVWDLDGERELRTLTHRDVRDVALSGDGRVGLRSPLRVTKR
jgi:WD40 repeat protein